MHLDATVEFYLGIGPCPNGERCQYIPPRQRQ